MVRLVVNPLAAEDFFLAIVTKKNMQVLPSLDRAKKGYVLHRKRFSDAYAQSSQWYVGDTLDPYIVAHRKKRNYVLESMMAEWAVDIRLDDR